MPEAPLVFRVYAHGVPRDMRISLMNADVLQRNKLILRAERGANLYRDPPDSPRDF